MWRSSVSTGLSISLCSLRCPLPQCQSHVYPRSSLFGSENEFRISPRERDALKQEYPSGSHREIRVGWGRCGLVPSVPLQQGPPPHPQDLHCYTNEVPGTRVCWMQIELSLHLLFIAEMGLFFPFLFWFFFSLHVSYLLMSVSNSIKTMVRRQLCSDWSPHTLLTTPRDTLPLPPSFWIPAASGLLEKVPKLLIQNRYSFAWN